MTTHLDVGVFPCMLQDGEEPHTCGLSHEGWCPNCELCQNGVQGPGHYLSIHSRRTAQKRKWQTEGVGGGSVSWYPWRGWRWAYMGTLGLLGLYMKRWGEETQTCDTNEPSSETPSPLRHWDPLAEEQKIRLETTWCTDHGQKQLLHALYGGRRPGISRQYILLPPLLVARQPPWIMWCSAELSGSYTGDGLTHGKLELNGLLFPQLKEPFEEWVFVWECRVTKS